MMIAVEQSTPTGSVALIRDSQVVGIRQWAESRNRRQPVTGHIRDLMRESSVGWPDIEGYAVGVGPGGYSSLRVAVVTVTALALPDAKPVYAVASADVLALESAIRENVRSVLVVGDARREQLWWRLYTYGDAEVKSATSWQLAGPQGIDLPLADVAVTWDWERIGERVASLLPAGTRLAAEPRAPTAAGVGALALSRQARGVPSERLAPIYLHAAVAAKSGCAHC